jgi:DNA-binding NtrC family response regulator
MNNALNILVAEEELSSCHLFRTALEGMKIKTILNFVNDGEKLTGSLTKESSKPHILFINLDLPLFRGMESLSELRANTLLTDVIIALFSRNGAAGQAEEALARGANIFFIKPEGFQALKTVLEQVINRYWQYYTSGMNMHNLLMNIGNPN